MQKEGPSGHWPRASFSSGVQREGSNDQRPGASTDNVVEREVPRVQRGAAGDVAPDIHLAYIPVVDIQSKQSIEIQLCRVHLNQQFGLGHPPKSRNWSGASIYICTPLTTTQITVCGAKERAYNLCVGDMLADSFAMAETIARFP